MLRFIPNILTFGRFVLTIVFLVMILYTPAPEAENRALFLDIAFVLFVIAGLTDIVDGMIARMYGVTSKFGRMLDPLVDKVLVGWHGYGQSNNSCCPASISACRLLRFRFALCRSRS